MSETPFHILISYAYLRKSLWVDVDQLAECSWFMIDSGAFTNHTNDLKHGKAGLVNPDTITLNEYCEFVEKRGNNIYGAIALDRIGDEATSSRNLNIMVDRGVIPIPVITVDQPAERINEYRAINPIVCAPSGYGRAYSEEFRKQRFRELKAASDGPVYLHGLGYTRFPGLIQSALHSGDSSSFTTGKRFGLIQMFSTSGLRGVHRTKIKPADLMDVLPLRLDYGKIKRSEPSHVKGGMSAIGNAGGVAFAKFMRIAWARNRRMFMAASNIDDLALAMASYWLVCCHSGTMTQEEFCHLRRTIVSGGKIAEPYFTEMKRIKNENLVAPH